MIETYPLHWPDGQPRTPIANRRRGRFHAGFTQSRDSALRELKLLGAIEPKISSNIPLRRDGLPYTNSEEPKDSGIALYCMRKSAPVCIACDSYLLSAHNMRAIAMTIAALRTIQRHGTTELLDRAFTGFTALPPANHIAWWSELGIERSASAEEIQTAFRTLAAKFHPDIPGGSNDAMARLNRAYELARSERNSDVGSSAP